MKPIAEILRREISEYWKPYAELEKAIENALIANGMSPSSVYCTGEVSNLYVYVQVGTKLFVYNEAEDWEHAFLLKSYDVEPGRYSNCIAEIFDISFSLEDLPRVVLINMCVLENFPVPRLNLSTGAIAAYIRLHQKARVIILDMQLRISISDIMDVLEKNPPNLIGISISFGQKNLADELLTKFKNSVVLKDSVIAVGNVIPSLYAEEYLTEYPSVIVSYGEGEESLLDLIDYALGSLSLEKVRGIAYVDEDKHICKNKMDFLDISELPFPAIDTLLDIIKYNGAFTLELSRGCNYSQCTFCPRAHKGGRWRYLSVDRMVLYFTLYADICSKLKQDPSFYIADEEFIGQLPHEKEQERMMSFCSRIKALNLNIHFDISARVDSIYKPNVSDEQNIEHLQIWAMLKEIGLNRLFLGVESGCDAQLIRYNKGTTSEQNAVALKLITALGINIRFGYITFDPLMLDFDEIISGHHFIERTDVLYNAVDIDKISLTELYNAIVHNSENVNVYPKDIPLYSKISYPLTSLEVLTSTKYLSMIREYQSLHGKVLLKNVDLNMARYKTEYVNNRIGQVSDACQRWIDYNFPVMYTLKGLHKTSVGDEKKRIFTLMEMAKSIDHYLLNFILYQLGIADDYTVLYKFAEANRFVIRKFDGDTEKILLASLNAWQNVEANIIYEIDKALSERWISDTKDNALKIALCNWSRYRGIWKTIN